MIGLKSTKQIRQSKNKKLIFWDFFKKPSYKKELRKNVFDLYKNYSSTTSVMLTSPFAATEYLALKAT